MNIWYLHPYAGGPGVGRYWRPYSFAKAWQEDGHKVRVFTARYHHLLEPDVPRGGRAEISAVSYDFVPTLRYRGNGGARVLSMLLFAIMLVPCGIAGLFRHGRPDLIIYSSPHPYGYISAWLLARLFRASVYLEVRDIWPLSLVELGGMSPSHPMVWLTGLLERFAYRTADHVISLIPAADQHMRSKGLAPERFSWVPNGADELPVMADEQSSALLVRLRELRQEGKFIVIYTGAHGAPNALHLLLDAASHLQKENRARVHFVLVGRGEQKADLQARSAKLGLRNLEFFDQVEKRVAVAAMGLADAGALCLKPEPIFRFGVSPNKLWDYMLAALPVVFVCRAANNPVLDYGCGVAADPADPVSIAEAILTLSRLPAVDIQEMGARGRQAVLDSYLYTALAAKVTAIYRTARA